jgi:hypothetical protein
MLLILSVSFSKMDHQFADCRFTTIFVFDDADGYSGFDLHQTRGGATQRVARILYWDACGQFCFETFGTDVPVQIVEELIAEARASIRLR